MPGWGANTMRTEFAVLTGIPETALGYDRFNPYYGLARVPIDRRSGGCARPAIARSACTRSTAASSAATWRCRRSASSAFSGARPSAGRGGPPYQSDPELAGHILRVLDAEGPQTFIFAITMGNHGPWLPDGPPLDPGVSPVCSTRR